MVTINFRSYTMCDIKITALKDAIALKDLTILPANGIKNVNTIEEAQSLLDSLRTQKFAQTNPWAEAEQIINNYQRKALKCEAVGDFIGANVYYSIVKHLALNFYLLH